MELASRLRERLPEIEETIFARMVSVADPAEVEDPEYVSGLRIAVRTGIQYGLAVAEAGNATSPEAIPAPLLSQARAAARIGISLDVVLRRYFAGYMALGEFVRQEVEKLGPLGAEEARRLARTQAPLFDRLVAAVTEAYRQEVEGRRGSTERALAERVKRLLAGELVDDPGLGYELGARWHLGIGATGPGAPQAIRRLAVKLDRRLLLVQPGGGVVWGWLGGRRKLSCEELEVAMSFSWPEEVILATGEAAHGVTGWRLSHRQALAALPVASRDSRQMVRYRDVALLASALDDELLSRSMNEIYLAPLAVAGDEGATLRQTLRAYFAAGRNVSSAAAGLGVSRKTVNSRLRTIEERVGRSIDACAAEMETALRLQGLFEGRIP